jgi:Na+-translocating ferredoxin:NAD+ oxidoreductase RnfD subunit
MWRKLKRFFRTPKGMLCIILAILAGMAAPGEGIRMVLPGLAGGAMAAGLIDALIIRVRNKRRPGHSKTWEFPDGAILTAVIIAMVLRAQEPWYVTTIVSVIAILSKYVFRSRTANVFNPAAFAIVATFYVFHTGQSWWGSLAGLPLPAQGVLLIAGIFIADRVNKLPLVLVFLGTYFLLFALTAFLSEPRRVAEIFRPPDVEAVLFFAFIILTDPPTSPAKYPDQIVCGILVAATSYAFFEWAGVVYYLLVGVLAGNVWEAWRRVSRRRGNTFPTGVGAFLAEVGPLRAR